MIFQCCMIFPASVTIIDSLQNFSFSKGPHFGPFDQVPQVQIPDSPTQKLSQFPTADQMVACHSVFSICNVTSS